MTDQTASNGDEPDEGSTSDAADATETSEAPEWCPTPERCSYPECLDLDVCASAFMSSVRRPDPEAFRFPPRRVRVPSPRNPI
jgi:hypothetical protein